MKASQRVRREEEEAKDTEPHPEADISTSVVRRIDSKLAATIIDQYEWMERMPAIVSFCYGIFFDEVLGGCVVYSPEYGENLKVWDKYGWTGPNPDGSRWSKIILLSRGACVWWAHPHSASHLIRQSMKMLPDKYEVVTATVDELAGEVGTIYQACGWSYVGKMRSENPNSKANSATRSGGARINGVLYTTRSLRHMIGSSGKDAVLKSYPEAEFVQQRSKGRYFAFRGSHYTKKNNLKMIEPMLKPYPKRG